MKYGPNGDIWITWNEISKEEAEPVYNLVLDCKTMEEVGQVLQNNGFIWIEDLHGKGCGPIIKYANNNQVVVKVYKFQRSDLTVTINRHSFDSAMDLMRFHESFERICNMGPIEMQS